MWCTKVTAPVITYGSEPYWLYQGVWQKIQRQRSNSSLHPCLWKYGESITKASLKEGFTWGLGI